MDVKTDSGAYFFVGRYSPYSTTGTMIPYDVAQLNIGSAMNLASGVFTAPVSGRYQFNFVAQANVDNTAGTQVLLRLNEGRIGSGFGPSYYDNLAMTATLDLKKNDRIDTFLNGGAIQDCGGCYYIQFTGMLLEEDLVLS